MNAVNVITQIYSVTYDFKAQQNIVVFTMAEPDMQSLKLSTVNLQNTAFKNYCSSLKYTSKKKTRHCVLTSREWHCLQSPVNPNLYIIDFGVYASYVLLNAKTHMLYKELRSPYISLLGPFMHEGTYLPLRMSRSGKYEAYTSQLDKIAMCNTTNSITYWSAEHRVERTRDGVYLYLPLVNGTVSDAKVQPEEVRFAGSISKTEMLIISEDNKAPIVFEPIVVDFDQVSQFLAMFFSIENAITFRRYIGISANDCDAVTCCSYRTALEYLRQSAAAGYSVQYFTRGTYGFLDEVCDPGEFKAIGAYKSSLKKFRFYREYDLDVPYDILHASAFGQGYGDILERTFSGNCRLRGVLELSKCELAQLQKLHVLMTFVEFESSTVPGFVAAFKPSV